MKPWNDKANDVLSHKMIVYRGKRKFYLPVSESHLVIFWEREEANNSNLHLAA